MFEVPDKLYQITKNIRTFFCPAPSILFLKDIDKSFCYNNIIIGQIKVISNKDFRKEIHRYSILLHNCIREVREPILNVSVTAHGNRVVLKELQRIGIVFIILIQVL